MKTSLIVAIASCFIAACTPAKQTQQSSDSGITTSEVKPQVEVPKQRSVKDLLDEAKNSTGNVGYLPSTYAR